MSNQTAFSYLRLQATGTKTAIRKVNLTHLSIRLTLPTIPVTWSLLIVRNRTTRLSSRLCINPVRIGLIGRRLNRIRFGCRRKQRWFVRGGFESRRHFGSQGICIRRLPIGVRRGLLPIGKSRLQRSRSLVHAVVREIRVPGSKGFNVVVVQGPNSKLYVDSRIDFHGVAKRPLGVCGGRNESNQENQQPCPVDYFHDVHPLMVGQGIPEVAPIWIAQGQPLEHSP